MKSYMKDKKKDHYCGIKKNKKTEIELKEKPKISFEIIIYRNNDQQIENSIRRY